MVSPSSDSTRHGRRWVSSQARARALSASSATASRRARPQAPAHAGEGRSQLRSSAGIASLARSALQPGSSLQGTSSQRARGWSIVPPMATGPAIVGRGRRFGARRLGRAGAPGAGGPEPEGLEQPTSTAAKPAASVPRMVPARRLAPWKVVDMWVILLEAVVALALLGGIVWWTMFAGRRRGERRDPD